MICKNKQVNRLSCSVCNKVFDAIRSLKMHEKRKHKLYMKQNCDMCNAAFSSQQNLQQHKVNSHSLINSPTLNKDQVLVSLTDCDVQNLSNDEVTETPEEVIDIIISKQFSCNICSREFKTNSGMRVHMSKMHKKDTNATKMSIVTRKQSAKITGNEITHNINECDIKDGDMSKKLHQLTICIKNTHHSKTVRLITKTLKVTPCMRNLKHITINYCKP